jgi:hypothetical protein
LTNSSSKSVTSSSSVLLISTAKSAKTNAKTLFYVVQWFSHITFLKIEMFTSINCSLFHQISSKLLHVWYANKAKFPRLHCKHSQPHLPANPREKAKIEGGGDLGSYTTPSVMCIFYFFPNIHLWNYTKTIIHLRLGDYRE